MSSLTRKYAFVRAASLQYACIAWLLVCACAHAVQTDALTLEKIMADADWIGPPVVDPYWSVDGRTVYYSLKRVGSPLKDLHRAVIADGKDTIVDPAARATADMPAVYDPSGTYAAFVRNGDVFVRLVRSGKLIQITRTLQKHESPQFSADGKLLSFKNGNDWYVHDFSSGVTAPAAVLKAEKDPDATPDADDLRDVQLRTFSTLKRLHDDTEAANKESDSLRKADLTRLAAAFYLGEDVVVRASVLSPDARWLLVVTAPKGAVPGREGQLTRYVTESGFEEFEKERVRVGRNPPAAQSLLLLNLPDHSIHPLSIDTLPGISEDPLKPIREENAQAHPWVKVQPEGAGKSRGVVVSSDEYDAQSGAAVWSPDSSALAIEMFAIDNKDRWIASVDLSRYTLVPQTRVSDPAWVNSSEFKDLGWLVARTLWFQSEESGYGQLYTKQLGAEPRALTQGRFEVSSPVLSPDRRWVYLLSNAAAPYSYDVYRVASSGGGPLQRLTHFEGVEHFSLQHSGQRLLVTHSSAYIRPQIAVVDIGSDKTHVLTDTRTADYKAMTWIEPEIVQIPSTHFDGVIYGKLYRAAPGGGSGKHPAVRAWGRIPAGCEQALLLLFSRADVQQFIGTAWLYGARHRLPSVAGIRPSVAHCHLSADGSSGTGGYARRQTLADGERRGGRRSHRRLWGFIRRLYDANGDVSRSGSLPRARRCVR